MRELKNFVPFKHPLPAIREMVNVTLAKLGPLLPAMYAAEVKGGRPSIAPEKLLSAMLLQVLYSVRSARQLMEQVHYNLLFRWFIGLSMDDSVWVSAVFTGDIEGSTRLISCKQSQPIAPSRQPYFIWHILRSMHGFRRIE